MRIVGGHSKDTVYMASDNNKQADYYGTPCAFDGQNGTWIVQVYEWGKMAVAGC